MTPKQDNFLQRSIFSGLKNLNDGFDSLAIPHFGPDDFQKVLGLCERFQVAIFGIEIFENRNQLLHVAISHGSGYEWAHEIVRSYCARTDVSFCASFDVSAVFYCGA